MTTRYPEIHFTKVFLHLSPDGKPDQFSVSRPFVYFHPLLGDRVVPSGFISDGLSVPQILWGLIPPHGIGFPAAVIHDDCYIHNLGADRCGDTVARRVADQMFRDNCRKLGMPEWEVKLIYKAVRFFGAANWKKFKKQLHA